MPLSKRTDYLDIILDLENESYEPFTKPSQEIQYINKRSNHPRTIINQIPKIIEDRISMLSSSQEIFERNKIQYQDALKKSGYITEIKYKPLKPNNKANKKN